MVVGSLTIWERIMKKHRKSQMYEIGKKNEIYNKDLNGYHHDEATDLVNIHGLIFQGADLRLFSKLVKRGGRVAFSLRDGNLVMESSIPVEEKVKSGENIEVLEKSDD